MSTTLAPIDPAKMYPLPVFQETVGQGRAALATARQNGLIIRQIGNRKYVLGADWIDYVVSHGQVEEPAQ